MLHPTLIVTGGLPGSGKTTISKGIARKFAIPLFSMDRVEANFSISNLPKESIRCAAYKVVAALAEDTIRLGGCSVVIDAVNPIDKNRVDWKQLSVKLNCRFVFIEVACSDLVELHRRIETRNTDCPEAQVCWERLMVQKKKYGVRENPDLFIDTTCDTYEESIANIVSYIQGFKNESVQSSP